MINRGAQQSEFEENVLKNELYGTLCLTVLQHSYCDITEFSNLVF